MECPFASLFIRMPMPAAMFEHTCDTCDNERDDESLALLYSEDFSPSWSAEQCRPSGNAQGSQNS